MLSICKVTLRFPPAAGVKVTLRVVLAWIARVVAVPEVFRLKSAA